MASLDDATAVVRETDGTFSAARGGEGKRGGRPLLRLERWLEMPMVLPGFAWPALLVVELTRGLDAQLERLSAAIRGSFVFDFPLRLVLPPRRPRPCEGRSRHCG